MTTGGASDQPPLADDYVVEVNGNQRARPTADVFKNQPLLERAVALQTNRIKMCITALEAMRANLNRMKTALALLGTGVAERSNQRTVVEVSRAPTEVGDEKSGDRVID